MTESNSGDVLIRAAEPADLPAIYGLMVTGFADVFGAAFGGRPAEEQRDVLVRLRQCRPAPEVGLLVVVQADEVVGTTEWRTAGQTAAGLLPRLRVLIQLGPVGMLRFIVRTQSNLSWPIRAGEAQMPGTVVAPGYQGRGIGRLLMEHGLQVSAQAGVRVWHDLVAEDNLASQAMLKSLGFREVARLRPSWWQRRLGVSTTLVMERRAGQD